jgi:HEAT repeat protein
MEPLEFKPISDEDRRRILEHIKSNLKGTDSRKLRRVLLSTDWVARSAELAEPLLALVREGGPKIALAALEGLARLGSEKCEGPLAAHIRALFVRNKPSGAALRAECIRVLGRVGTKESVPFLAGLIRDPGPASEEEREAAVEALVTLAQKPVKGVAAVLQKLNSESEGVLREALLNALREVNAEDWESRGYLTIEAEFQRDKDQQ